MPSKVADKNPNTYLTISNQKTNGDDEHDTMEMLTMNLSAACIYTHFNVKLSLETSVECSKINLVVS